LILVDYGLGNNILRAIALAIALSVAGYMAFVIAAEWRGIAATISDLPMLLFFKVISLSLSSYFFRFCRWQLFLHVLKRRVQLMHSIEIYFAAFSFTLTPGKSGEVIRSLYLKKHGVSYIQSLIAFIAERGMDLIAVGLLALFVTSMFPTYQYVVVVLLLVLAVLLILLRTYIWAFVAKYVLKARKRRQIARMALIMRQLFALKTFAFSLLLSLLAWGAQGLSLYLITDAMATGLRLDWAVGIYALSLLVGALSFIPGGLGATEASIVYLLTTVGMAQQGAISASLISRVLTLWLAIGLGSMCMLRLGIRAK
jgi:glycosyltransferase 2 family protein